MSTPDRIADAIVDAFFDQPTLRDVRAQIMDLLEELRAETRQDAIIEVREAWRSRHENNRANFS
jgi:hypothetical protein